MGRVLGSSCIAVVLLTIELAVASPLAAQAKIEQVIGPATSVMVQRAGAAREEPATRGMSLLPGDLLRADASAKVELKCTTKGATTYLLPGLFRLFIDVPVDALCSVNLLEGHADVVAEEPSHTVGGTIPLTSKGTQYSVDVTREGGTGAAVCKVVVFEGEVFARGNVEATRPGTTARWVGRSAATASTTAPTNTQDIDRSAGLYATFDVATARAASPDTNASVSYEQLKALHYAVLSNPTDTAKRVELAKRQIQYKVDDQAAYNLKRANVTNDTAMRRYQIDPRTIRDRPVIRDRIYKSAATSVVRPDNDAQAAATTSTTTTSAAPTRAAAAVTAPATPAATATAGRVTGRATARAGAAVSAGARYPAAVTPAPPIPTTDTDFQLIATGQLDAAVRNLESRVAAGTATSRDHYALAKAYDNRDPAKVREHGTRAISLHVTDGKLSEADLEDVRDLLGRAG